MIPGSSRLSASRSGNPSIPLSPGSRHPSLAYPGSAQGPRWPQELPVGAPGPWSCWKHGRAGGRFPLSLAFQRSDLRSVPVTGVPSCWGKGKGQGSRGQMSRHGSVGATGTARGWGTVQEGTCIPSLGDTAPAPPAAPLHLGLSVPSFTLCSGPSSAPAQEAAPAPPQVTAARRPAPCSEVPGHAGVLPSTRTLLGPSSPRSIPIPRGEPAAAHRIPRRAPQGLGGGSVCRTRGGHPPPWVSGMFGSRHGLNPSLLHHWKDRRPLNPQALICCLITITATSAGTA